MRQHPRAAQRLGRAFALQRRAAQRLGRAFRRRSDRQARPTRTNFWNFDPKAPEGPQKWEPNSFGSNEFIRFCQQVGLDYVSCSPYRVPIARLAAAQAAVVKAG